MIARATRLAAALLMLACVAVLAGPAAAQQERTGTIAGSVVDEKDGAPLDGVRVTLIRPDGSQEKRVTRADGSYEFKDLAEGDYELNFAKDGFTDSRIAVFPVKPG